MCFVWISEQTAIISLYNINWLVFITVYCAVRAGSLYIIIIIIIIIIGIQPLGRSGQRPEISQATGMALVRCILGKFLGLACHCFPPSLYIIRVNFIGL